MKKNSNLSIVKDLAQIFPDIEGQLCSRHSILLGKIKNTFTKMYDGMQPQHYVIVKGLLEVFHTDDVNLSMALQNGIILMQRKIDVNSQIFINSNHFDEQLILTCNGKQQEGLNANIEQISKVIMAANQGLKNEQIYGGIFYLHCNIPQDSFYYKEIMLMSLFLGIGLINGNLSNFNIKEIVKRMEQTKIMGNNEFLSKFFGFKNREFDLRVGDTKLPIKLQSKYKLVLCQLDLASFDIQFQRARKKLLQTRKRQILRKCKDQSGLDTVLKIFSSQDADLSLKFENEIQQSEQILEPQKFLDMSLKQLGLLSQFSGNNITFEQLVSAQWEINSKYWKIHSDEVVELVEEVKSLLKLNSCMIINETFLLIVTEKNKYTDLLIYLRGKLHKGELKSKSLFKIEEELVEHRWSSDKRIGQKMFTSVPSYGISIFDPSEAIWFD